MCDGMLMNDITALISLQYHLREIASRDDIDGELASSLFETALEIDDFFTRNGLEATAIDYARSYPDQP